MPITDAAARLEAIADYRNVDAPVDPNLEGLAALATTLCHVSGAAVNIIDDRYQHQVATAGVEAAICDRQDSMCAVVLPNARHVWVPDASVDERFAENPFVTGCTRPCPLLRLQPAHHSGGCRDRNALRLRRPWPAPLTASRAPPGSAGRAGRGGAGSCAG